MLSKPFLSNNMIASGLLCIQTTKDKKIARKVMKIVKKHRLVDRQRSQIFVTDIINEFKNRFGHVFISRCLKEKC